MGTGSFVYDFPGMDMVSDQKRNLFCMLRISFFCLLAVLPVSGLRSERYNEKPEIKRPNFIVIVSDDQRHDALGSNGNSAILTPILDQMAANAVSFANAHVVFSLCSPSRAAILTGRYGSANGVLGLGSALNPGEKTIADHLREAGYHTGVSGKWHISQRPKEAGFDFYATFESNGDYYNRLIQDMGKEVRPEKHCDEYCAERSVDFLKQAIEDPRPFFLLHCTQVPHMNHQFKWDAKKETLAKYDPADMPVAKNRTDDLAAKPEYLKTVRNRTQAALYGYPDVGIIQDHTRDYYSVITEMDNTLGKLFKTVEESDIRDNTYIIFMSDNGWMLGEHGMTSKVLPYGASTRIPLLITGPALSARTEKGIVLNIDIAPTLLELAGVPDPGNLHGKSLVPVLTGKSDKIRQHFVYEGLGDYGGTKPNLAVASEQYLYIATFEDETLQKIIFREIYDQKKDREEMNNLADSKRYRRKQKHFEAIINDHKKNVLESQ